MKRTEAPDSRWRLLAKDRILRTIALAYGLTLIVIVVSEIAPQASFSSLLRPLIDPALVGMTVTALLWGRDRIDRDERRFWDVLALAWACLLLVEAFFVFDLSPPFLSASLTTDALYIFFYLIFALAVDFRPHLDAAPQVRRHRLESVAGLTALFGVLVYFAIVVVPEPLGVSLSFVPREHGFTPLLLVRLSLDIILLGRLIYAMVGSGARWRLLYGLLAGGMSCFALKDALAVLAYEGLLSAPGFRLPHHLFLSLPALFMIFAARCRHLPGHETPDQKSKGEVDLIRISPLTLYTVIVPALHFSLYPLGLLEPSSRPAREVFCLLYVLVLGFLGWLHQGLIVKDGRRAIGALREAEARLFRSQRLESVGRLAGGIAHDFNNYLTVIRGYCELVRHRVHDPDTRTDIRYVEDAAGKATNLTRQLLAFGRRQVLRPEALDLNAVVLDTSKLLGSLLGEDVILEIDLDPELGRVEADLGQTEQVLMNLALNGRDAMPRGGTLRIRTGRVQLNAAAAVNLELEPGLYACLAIEDTGCGMSEEVQAHVFEPFFTTKGSGRGTGLGLSTVHGIMAQSAGAITLESTPEKGTTVHVLFPTTSERPGSEAPSAAHPPTTSPKATLLVVEDNEQVRRLVVQALTESGFRVHEASGGPEALERFPDYEPIDMLITDVMMNEMDGIELTNALVSRSPGLRVLFISGYPLDTLQERQAVLPASIELLEKPFSPAELLAKTNEVLAQLPPERSRRSTQPAISTE